MQRRPPQFKDLEYDSYADSDLWDLPSTAQLHPLEGNARPQPVVEGAELCSDKIILGNFDLDFAFRSVLEQTGLEQADVVEWGFSKYVEEPEFGPGSAINVVYIEGKLLVKKTSLQGLSIIQKCNADAILLAHKNTMSRIKKDDWSLGYTSVSGAEEICIGGQRLSIIFAPGHTDGHMALLDNSTNSLIVGAHCLGKVFPVARSREDTILKAIEGGAESLYDIVASVYAGVDRSYWLMASYNVRVHVDHLTQLDKLPKDFSTEKFQRSCWARFFMRWLFSYTYHASLSRLRGLGKLSVLIAGCLAVFASVDVVKYRRL